MVPAVKGTAPARSMDDCGIQDRIRPLLSFVTYKSLIIKESFYNRRARLTLHDGLRPRGSALWSVLDGLAAIR